MTRFVIIRMVLVTMVCLGGQIGFAADNFETQSPEGSLLVSSTLMELEPFSSWSAITSPQENSIKPFSLKVGAFALGNNFNSAQWFGIGSKAAVFEDNPDVTTSPDPKSDYYGYFEKELVVPANIPVPEPAALSLVALATSLIVNERRKRRTRELETKSTCTQS